MFFTLTKRSLCIYALAILTSLSFFSCQKEFSSDNGGIVTQPGTPPDLTTKIKSSVSGFVTDENDVAVQNATVQMGTGSVTTDKYGYFEIKNVPVIKNAAAVTVNKQGYFAGIRTYSATEGKSAFFRIKLLPKTTVGSVNASTGGTVSLSSGLKIVLPSGGLVIASTNTPYTGTVNVAAQWLNPSDVNSANSIPGDQRGIGTNGSLQSLKSFGIAAVELTGTAGERLQITPGKKATLTIAIPANLQASAPATLPLWYFDETAGLWKQEGNATKTGNNYEGEVAHFTFWNYGYGGPTVHFDLTLKDAAGNPLPFTLISITDPVGYTFWSWGYTDSTGYVGGDIAQNAQLILNIFGDHPYYCPTPIYTQSITTTTSNISLGTITISTPAMAMISGTVTNCANQPVSNGYLHIQKGYVNFRYELNSNGTFNFPMALCANNMVTDCIAEDLTTGQQSASITYTFVAGNNNLGNIQACGVSTQEYMNYSVNGTSYNYSAPADYISQGVYITGNAPVEYIGASRSTAPYNSSTLVFDQPNIAAGSNQPFQAFRCSQITDSVNNLSPITVHISEFGAVGTFISGSFSGTLTGVFPPYTAYVVNCNFRVRRYN